MLPQDIARVMQPEEYEKLCEKVFEEYKQGFVIKRVSRGPKNLAVEVQLDDRTNHDIEL